MKLNRMKNIHSNLPMFLFKLGLFTIINMDFPVSPIVANLYMEYFEQKALSTAFPPGFGTSMWMTLLSSKRKKINKTPYNT